MQTLAPAPIWPELSLPSCEQVLPGDTTGEDQDGKIGSGSSDDQEQEPLQGEGDSDDDEETGSEGDGT
ncbi:MAG: hypothetical protein ABI186_00335 [Candidatus Elarobacter sp.]